MNDETPSEHTTSILGMLPAPHPWNLLFAGQWCLLQMRTGLALEALVSSVTDAHVWCSEVLQVYNQILGVRDNEAVIEPQTVCIPLDEVVLIRTADRRRAERFCAQLTGARLTQGVNTVPIHPRIH